MRKVLVLGGGHRGSGKMQVMREMLAGMGSVSVCGNVSVPVEVTVEPYKGDDERVKYVAREVSFNIAHIDPAGDDPRGDSTALMDELLRPMEFRLEEFVMPEQLESEPPTNWAVPRGSITMQMSGEQAEKFEEFVRQLRAAEILRDVQRMGRAIMGTGSSLGHRALALTSGYAELTPAWDQKIVVKTRGKVHTTGRSRAARADRWR